MKRLVLFWIVILFAGCENRAPVAPGPNAGNEIVLRSGTSAGYCLGYCYTELQIDANGMVFRQFSREPDRYPERKLYATLPVEEWQTLLQSLDLQALAQLDSVIGCPDCTDRGAEWIEVTAPGFQKRVVFETGDTLQAIAPMLQMIRQWRNRFVSSLHKIVTGAGYQVLPPVQITDQPPDSLLLAYYGLESTTLRGDSLFLRVVYGGGCKPHFFVLYMAPSAFLESFPVQANLYLFHNANGDVCKALVHRRLAFDVRAIAQWYSQSYQQPGDILLNLHEFNELGARLKFSLVYRP